LRLALANSKPHRFLQIEPVDSDWPGLAVFQVQVALGLASRRSTRVRRQPPSSHGTNCNHDFATSSVDLEINSLFSLLSLAAYLHLL
ncbi:MAG TPA: hypothetical protein VN833_25480, partial [Candidatus Acidoferrales bacterium]|nr:hypothetical protein [Candidatus Acidoferrales bacterium]